MPLQRKVKGFFHIYDDSKSPPQLLITIAGVKTRNQSYSKLSELVGPGKELLTSEVPTLFAVIQKGILIRERVLVELGKAKTEVHSKDIIA